MLFCVFSRFSFSVPEKLKVISSLDVKKEPTKDVGSDHIAAQTFTFRELAAATKNFRSDCLLGEGGFGRVYKGRLESMNQVGQVDQILIVIIMCIIGKINCEVIRCCIGLFGPACSVLVILLLRFPSWVFFQSCFDGLCLSMHILIFEPK